MKHLNNIFILLAMGLALTACNDDNSVDYTQYYGWRDKNNQITDVFLNDIQTIKDAGSLYFADTIYSQSEPYSVPILYHVIKSANEDSLRAIGRWITPFYTSTLKVHYTLYSPKSVMKRFEDNGIISNRDKRNDADLMNRIFGIGHGIENKLKADTLESMQVQYYENFTCGSVITGWGDALQHMHIGDTWLIQIPWYLAYGQAGSGSNISPYSNLFFRLELCDITSWGGNIEQK